MKRLTLFILFVLSPLFAQDQNVNSITFNAPSPPQVTGVSASVASGRPSINTYVYWVVPVYPIGRGPVSRPFMLRNVPDSGTVNVGWNPATGATGYDVLRTTSVVTTPTTGCGCALVVNQSAATTGYTDTLGATIAYSVSNFVSSVSLVETLDNLNFAIPLLNIDGSITANNIQSYTLEEFGGSANGITDNTPALTSLQAAVPNGIVYLKPGTYLLKSSVSVTSALQFVGIGKYGSKIKRDGSFTSGDMFVVSANGVGFHGIWFDSSTLGGNIINVGGGSDISDFTADSCKFELVTSGNAAIAFNGGASTGIWFSRITNNLFGNTQGSAITASNGGDSDEILYNVFPGGSGSEWAINWTGLGGSAQLLIANNNISGFKKSIQINSGTEQIKMYNNQTEQVYANTNTCSAVFCLAGGATTGGTYELIGNNINGHNNATNAIYVDQIQNAHIRANVISNVSYWVQTTTNASNINLYPNTIGAGIGLLDTNHRTITLFSELTPSSVVMQPIAQPSTPVITNAGTAGATTYGYKIVAYNAAGYPTEASVEGTTATGNAVLSATNYNIVTFTLPTGTVFVNVYRTTGGATQGKINTINVTASPFNDTGLAASGAASSNNLTGGIYWVTDNRGDIGQSGSNRPRNLYLAGTAVIGVNTFTANMFASGVNSGALYQTATNCTSSASPAVCAAAAAGSVVIAAAATSVVVNTTAVTANSQILIQDDSSLGTKLSVTCNTQALGVLGSPRITARTAATNFTITIDVGPTTNPLCLSYSIIN